MASVASNTTPADRRPVHRNAGPYSSACTSLAAMLKRAPLLAICMLLGACGKPMSVLQQVQHDKELIVITRNSATTYYEGPDGPAGFEYDLASRFADFLGVKLHIVVAPGFNNILSLVALGDAHLAAAGLAITDRRKEKVRFGPVYYHFVPQLVYRSGSVRPRNLDDLHGTLEVVRGSSHEERLEKLKATHPHLKWKADPDVDSEELMSLVWQQLIDYTVADSHELAINRNYYPELKPAFDLGKKRSLAWAFPQGKDDSLLLAATVFFNKIRRNGVLNQLIERYFGHVARFDYVGTRRYRAHVAERLPKYEPIFKRAATETGIDWRLLAAIGYQESHWDPDAVSPTGVKGIMMLTTGAAQELGIDDREDVEQSITGGAEYLEQMIGQIPDRIPEPDRTWMALAAYNVGLGHLEDARILTLKNKGDADKWVDVKKNLPLLSKEKWFKQTRHGYARGREPVRYVENIRTYYDILVWITDQEKSEATVQREPLQFDSPAL